MQEGGQHEGEGAESDTARDLPDFGGGIAFTPKEKAKAAAGTRLEAQGQQGNPDVDGLLSMAQQIASDPEVRDSSPYSQSARKLASVQACDCDSFSYLFKTVQLCKLQPFNNLQHSVTVYTLLLQDVAMEEAKPIPEDSLNAPTEFVPKARRQRNIRNRG